MTAEKMKLDRFCQIGEYLAYKIALPSEPKPEADDEVCFIFSAELEDRQYHFTNDDIDEDAFTTFELHLSRFLNDLFQRKMGFEKRNEMFKSVMTKLVSELSEEEQQCLATNIDSNTMNVLKALGVSSDE